MNDKDTNFCRLCATLKSNRKLIDLRIDEEKRSKMIEKLLRLNIVCEDLNNQNHNLPKTVCFSCIENLDRAFEFVLEVDKAQELLNDMISTKPVKKEECSSDDNFEYDVIDIKSDETVDIKTELVEDFNTDLQSASTEFREVSKIKLNKIEQSLDAIPLSQLKLTWADYSWTCAYCDTQFPSVEELRVHSMQYHQCCNPYKCIDCNIRKLCLDSFLSHVKRHRKYLKLSCYLCYEKFSSPHEYYFHKQNVHTWRAEYTCRGCNTEFQTMDNLNEHNLTFNKSKRTRPIPLALKSSSNLTCIICKKMFKSKGSLNTHLLIHTDRKREHTCEKCGKCFLSKHNLDGHLLSHDNVKPYSCEICKLKFKTVYKLRAHVGTHNTEKPYKCDQCGRCFRLQKQLSSHSIIHTDSLPHMCSYCNKRFRFRTILNQHVRQHTGVKPYSCENCQRDFTNWPNYNKHMKRRHGMDMAKKKHTPDGVYPINPSTGEVVVHLETNKMLEWKEQILRRKRPGRPKVNKEFNS